MTNTRFIRTQALIGDDAFLSLQNASVMIVGLGAVGGYALEALARAGIGKLVLVDFDKFEESNINRQILALTSTIGQSKTQVALSRVKEINPECEVIIKDVFVNEQTIDELLSEPVDFVIDAIDSLNPKCQLMEELSKRGINFISSMGAALKTNPQNIKIQRLKKTQNCHLARFVRKRLVRRGVDIANIMCVASDEIADLPQTALFKDSEDDKRHAMGSLPTITAIFGLIMANHTILFLSKIKA